MHTKTHSFCIRGAQAELVTIEVDIRSGLPAFTIVGMADMAVRESRERIRAAILNDGFEFPQRRITVSVANGTGAPFPRTPSIDLPIAYAVLQATGQLQTCDDETIALVGELSLDGKVQPIRGALPMARLAAESGINLLAIPKANEREAHAAEHPPICAVRSLADLKHLAPTDQPSNPDEPSYAQPGPDIKDLRGHAFSIRALEIAAAGAHPTLFRGSPGCGKTMLARRLPSILPAMSNEEAIEVTSLQSIAGNLRVDGLAQQRPFRAPHHSISSAGLVGGKSSYLPGEASIAHAGVLFLDELPEFNSSVLESLEKVATNGSVSLTKGDRTITLPAQFQLVAATNRCPCGRAGTAQCRCTAKELERFNSRPGRPLIDRFDMSCLVERPTPAEVESGPISDSETIRKRTSTARQIQLERYRELPFNANGELDGPNTRRLLEPPDGIREMLNAGYRNNHLSLRGYDRTLRIARTIADLDQRAEINAADVAEALALRNEPPN